MNLHLGSDDLAANAAGPSPAKGWLRALEMTAPIAKKPARTLPVMIEELAEKFGDAPALLSDVENFTFRELAESIFVDGEHLG